MDTGTVSCNRTYFNQKKLNKSWLFVIILFQVRMLYAQQHLLGVPVLPSLPRAALPLLPRLTADLAEHPQVAHVLLLSVQETHLELWAQPVQVLPVRL